MAVSRMGVLPGLAVLVLSGAAAAQDIGRLFTTAPERSTLNQLRIEAQFARPEPEAEAVPEQVAQPQPPTGPSVSRLEVNGVVRRSGGPTTVWVNGAQVERGVVSREGLRVDPGRRIVDGVQVRLPSGLRSVRLKPGQAIDVNSGTLVDAFERTSDSQAESAFELGSEPQAAGPASASERAGDMPAGASLTPQSVTALSVAERTRALKMLLEAGATSSLLDRQGAPPTRGQ